jgi:hypothetical protein
MEGVCEYVEYSIRGQTTKGGTSDLGLSEKLKNLNVNV